MGNHMSNNLIKELPTNMARYTRRKLRRFYVIPRAEAQIDKIVEQKITSRAPLFESTMREVEKMAKEMPDHLQKIHEKDDLLHKNLEKVYVSSTGDNKDSFSRSQCDKDVIRRFYCPDELRQPEHIPEGKYNSTKIDQIICAYAKDPKIFSPELLAVVYKIDEMALKNILEYTKALTVIYPDKNVEKSTLQALAEDFSPRDMITSEHKFERYERKLIESTELFDKYHGTKTQIGVDYKTKAMNQDPLETLQTIGQIIAFRLKRRKQLRELRQQENKRKNENLTELDELVDLAHMQQVEHQRIKPEDVSLDHIIEDAIRRSEKRQQEEALQAAAPSKEKLNSHTRDSSPRNVNKQTDENEDDEGDIIDQVEKYFSRSARNENTKERSSFSSEGYYQVNDEHKKKKQN